MTAAIDMLLLRKLAKQALNDYTDATVSIDPSSIIQQPLNAKAMKAREDFNRYMDEIAKTDPRTPKGRL